MVFMCRVASILNQFNLTFLGLYCLAFFFNSFDYGFYSSNS
ncbi:hypothetical protein AAJ76_1330007479 [Vairimorpha ceranae]|uniref:Uncharacterized protein n=1 Tax=Vairimorpha ceranae TaxID=40302 RepID=A0A0F9WLT2_9MICR|nr:hypothetical protein AAJ76_1330007479 [Vairimorpha ceranae]KKO74038.1 hypothetical protein AAJ76_1330007479 [Vairimorpha ceranae]